MRPSLGPPTFSAKTLKQYMHGLSKGQYAIKGSAIPPNHSLLIRTKIEKARIINANVAYVEDVLE